MSKPGYVYLFRLGQYHKIGRATDVKLRAAQFSSLPFPFAVIHSFLCADPGKREKDLHAKHASCRVSGEWFDLSPEQVEAIRAIGNEPGVRAPVAVSGSGTQINLKLSTNLAARFAATADSLGLDPGNLAKTIIAECIGTYEDRAKKAAGDHWLDS